jgi:hypothetical protein
MVKDGGQQKDENVDNEWQKSNEQWHVCWTDTLETQVALGWTWFFSFWTIGGIKTLKVEDIGYNVQK